jgi:hypothetical protein
MEAGKKAANEIIEYLSKQDWNIATIFDKMKLGNRRNLWNIAIWILI